MEEPQTKDLERTDDKKEESPANDEEIKENETESLVTRRSKEDKGRKKGDKSVEQVLKALSTLGTSEEKLAAMCKKYADIVDENRKLQAQIKQCDKKVLALQREKEQLQAEHSKTILTRSRLESLCRELQKQNKQIKEESLQRVREEEEKRKTVSGKFQATLSEITTLMQQNNENNSKLRDENLEMQNKFKTVCEQYELREQQVEKMSKQMQLESQLAEAKLTKLKIEMVAEKALLENEKKQLLNELTVYQQKCQELQKTEADLNSQIRMFNEMYCAFQNAMSETSVLYDGLQREMKKMSNKVAKLENETSVWKMRWEDNQKALLQVASEKQQKVSELSLAARQLAQLQKLCRTLQADRTSLLMQLKSEGITPKLSGECNSEEPVIAENNCESQPLKSEPSGKIEENNSLDKENKEEVDKEMVNKETVEKEIFDKETIEKEIIDKVINEIVDKEVVENHEGSTSPEAGDNNSKEVGEEPRETEEVDSTPEADDKKDEVSKTDSNSKMKKGKEGSKKRKK